MCFQPHDTLGPKLDAELNMSFLFAGVIKCVSTIRGKIKPRAENTDVSNGRDGPGCLCRVALVVQRLGYRAPALVLKSNRLGHGIV